VTAAETDTQEEMSTVPGMACGLIPAYDLLLKNHDIVTSLHLLWPDQSSIPTALYWLRRYSLSRGGCPGWDCPWSVPFNCTVTVLCG
jgi:hypothetical protein